jgi:hypothetical protein
VASEVVAVQSLPYRQVSLREYDGVTPDGKNVLLPYLEHSAQNQLPLIMKETTNQEIEFAVGEVLKVQNRTLWLHRGLCPECVYTELDVLRECRQCGKSFAGGAS